MGQFAQALKYRHSLFSREERFVAQDAVELPVMNTTHLPQINDFRWHLLSAVVTQTVTYPARSVMNNAVRCTNLIATLNLAYPRLWHGVSANTGRGALVLAGQTWMQAQIHQHFGEQSYTGKVLGIVGPVAFGTVVANLIEMPIVQYNAGLPLSWNVRPGSIVAAAGRETAFMLQLSPAGNSFLFNVTLSAISQYHLVAHALDKNATGWKAAAPYKIGHELGLNERRVLQAKVAVNMFAGRAMFLGAFSLMNRFMTETAVPQMQEAQKRLGGK